MQYVKSSEDADEIVNDTFMVVWDKQEELQLDSGLKSYLYTIVRNKSLNLLKKKKIELSSIEENFEFVSDQVSPLEMMQAKETEEAVHALIDQLPTRCRQVFVFSRRENLPNKEIAAILGINEKTVENQITIAIKFIRSGLSGRNKNGSGISKILLFPWLLAYFIN